MEARADGVSRRASQRRKIGLSDCGCRRRVAIRRRVQPLIHVVLAAIDILAGNIQRIASEAGGGAGIASDGQWLAVLQSQNIRHAPSAEHGIGESAGIAQHGLSTPHRQIIASAEVENLAHVEITEAVITLNSKTGEPGRAVSANVAVQTIARVRPALGPRIVGQNAETVAVLAFECYLQRVIATVA